MGLLECASGASVWRGYNYYKEKKVVSLEVTGENIYSATVAGSSTEPYSVELHIDHPRKSKCNCPHADGKRIICKHIVATYFTVLPKEAERFYAEAMAYQEEEEKRQEEMSDKVIKYVGKMKKADLCQSLLELLFDGPEWQYDRFIRERGLDNDWY
jgi:uncharacterized Zn finger protein